MKVIVIENDVARQEKKTATKRAKSKRFYFVLTSIDPSKPWIY